ncbi:hypothetical protein ABLW82_002129 [Escherichia coli]|nr:hypothetical protein [Escherichia coli]EII9937375.1 hypothetical protein [Escherichia coli]EKE4262865.1 hypothetical protein [Escherichia coli]HAI8714113.1 hypothetical protein [Escherichia coli]
MMMRPEIFGRIFGNEKEDTKKPPEGGFTTLLIALILFLSFPWYPERDLNPHSANAEGF